VLDLLKGVNYVGLQMGSSSCFLSKIETKTVNLSSTAETHMPHLVSIVTTAMKVSCLHMKLLM